MSDEITKPIEDGGAVGTELPSEVLTPNTSSQEPVSSPITEPVEEPVVNPEPVIIPPKNEEQIEALPPSAPIPTTSESPLSTSPSSLEPSSIYSTNPKLNSAALAFISYMGRTKETLALANRKRKEQMMKRVYKVMELFDKKHARTHIRNRIGVGEISIKNDDVEKFIHVSDDTATKYLNILTKEGKIKREGKPHASHYTKVE
ncbi:MAG: hypothetical protein US21_C0016G0008 [Candidatus Nomurabacteria bacterium GW2011_GWB1_36_6]|nr:MAG: hypothetical protein US21_C0016G0008 [Candidatus Nomurabacteria bacterium GW2011_GWB1_36_6]